MVACLALLLCVITQDAVKVELEKLQGNWEAVSIEAGGEARTVQGGVATISVPTYDKSVDMPGRLTRFDEAVWTWKHSRQKGQPDSSRIIIDPSKEPKQMNGFSPRGRLSFGIYKLEGDTLIICFSTSPEPEDRPKEFKAGANGRNTLQIFKRGQR
jgi:uncharacterized protein (TIGR03067 family)